MTMEAALASSKKSTNVRKEIAPKWLKPTFRAIETISTPLAARLAARLFLTPPRYAAPASEGARLATGRRFTVPGLRGERLAAWFWGSGGPLVLLVHGWAGRGGQMTPFVEPLLGAGFSVVTFDAPAHGASDGRVASLVHFRDALRAMVEAVGPVHAIVAHSMGGASTAMALSSGLPVGRVVFIGSPSDASAYAQKFAVTVGISESVRAAMQARLERRLGVPMALLNVARLAPTQRARLLIVHDRNDREVAYENGEAIARAWPGAELVTTTGLGHHRVLRDSTVHARVVAFLADGVARPTGCATSGCGGRPDGEWGAYCPSCGLEHEVRQFAAA
jgi:pimeloyl-ACP methyl ester carboxylesterase